MLSQLPHNTNHITAMDNNIISQILRGCKLAGEIEANLPNLANHHPAALRSSCEDVVRAFNNAIHELDAQPHMLLGRDHQGLQAMDFLGPRVIEEGNVPFNEMGAAVGFGVGSSSAAAQEVESEMPFFGREQQGAVPVGEGSSSGMGRRPGTGSTGQRQSRKRKESRGMMTIRVPAVSTGNMENPPDDGHTWRKYGQKDILGSRFPRSYFRCTHKNFYGCDAKKQVQRLDEDPYTYEVTYCGDHTCQTSTTPVLLPPMVTNNPQTGVTMADAAVQNPSSSLSTSIQLGTSSWPFNIGPRDHFPSHAGESSAGPAHAGSSDCPVADLADVMFNSGSSGSSSMDAIFSLRHHESWKDKEE